MSDLDLRAERVRLIVEGNHGRVLSRDGEIMRVEVPGDVAPGLAGIWGQGGFSAQYTGQTTRDAPRRVVNWQDGRVIVCEGDLVTTAFFAYDIDLRPRSEGVQQPLPAGVAPPA